MLIKCVISLGARNLTRSSPIGAMSTALDLIGQQRSVATAIHIKTESISNASPLSNGLCFNGTLVTVGLQLPMRRWNSQRQQPANTDKIAEEETTSASQSDKNEESEHVLDSSDDVADDMVFYRAPLGDLIVRLKRISIASCVMSLIGLPAIVVMKNGFFVPSTEQLGLGTLALIGATGTTIALQFVFGPYILSMERLNVRQCSTKAEKDDDGLSTSTTTATQCTMIKAKTVNVFGIRKEIVFDPVHDTITPYTGTRPFANFVAKDTVLYAHPELLEDDLRKLLFWSESSSSSSTPQKNDQLSTQSSPNEMPSKKDKDDDFF